MFIRVIKCGLLTTVQDNGRHGHQSSGMPVCGAMDRISMRQANLLVSKDEDAPVLECIGIGLDIQFTGDIAFAVTGGSLDMKLNGEPAGMYQTVFAHKGDVLHTGPVQEGRVCYIAFSGTMILPPVLGSYSTDIRSRIGGYKGRPLQEGDTLEIIPDHLPYRLAGKKPEYTKTSVLRVLPGPQYDMFDDAEKAAFYSYIFRVSPDSDRMGIRLSSDRRITEKRCDIISEGNTPGAVQITGGHPILLMNDKAVTGGYAKIANVIAADLPKAAQLKISQPVCFEETTFERALLLYQEQEDALQRWKKDLQVVYTRQSSERIKHLLEVYSDAV